MHRGRFSLKVFLSLQALALAVFSVAWAGLSPRAADRLQEAVSGRPAMPGVRPARNEPLEIEPLYNEESVVSDGELAAVLRLVRPKFDKEHIKPNFVEHALRAWGADARFADPAVMSGADMRDFLLDKSRYVGHYGREVRPLLVDRPRGVAIRWGDDDTASIHHDHLLASLTEAGVPLDQRVYPPSGRRMTMNDVLQEALRDFRLDERETEWSVLGFGLWLAPETTHWTTSDGRTVSFDLLARRLMRGWKEYGVCSGTHRVYSLMALWRLNERFNRRVLSEDVARETWAWLEEVRDAIRDSQFDDGRWPPNWPEGRRAKENPENAPEYQQVIATGHHLEWLAIAPVELHPPREQIERAADWVISTTTSKTEEEIVGYYTFYSHVGNALALWRGTRPAEFWTKWTSEHPETEAALPPPAADEPADGGNDALLPPPPKP
ncbi:MAG: hypothetical protein KY476_25955 [Planctomycetes bacterium]|nr:hypothetical protein [Planctomycetota bacterium]